MTRLLVAVTLMVFGMVSVAGCQNKIQVAVKQESGEADSVGNRLAFAVREDIRKSSGYSLANGDDADTVIELVTATTQPGISSAGSLLITKKLDCSEAKGTLNIAHLVYVVGGGRIEDMAQDIMATLDHQVTEFKFLYKP